MSQDVATAEAREMSLRDLARGAVRDEVMRQAWTLFADQGFEATTVDQIAAAAGMSRRTFFRYFAGKDELVLERLVQSGEEVGAALRGRPTDEPAWPALRAAFATTVRVQEEHADRSRPLQLMLRDEPGIRASAHERRRRWLEVLVPLVADRLPDPASDGASGGASDRASDGASDGAPDMSVGGSPDVRAVAVAACALSCLEVAQEAWAEHPGSSLAGLLDEAMGAVAAVDRRLAAGRAGARPTGV